MNKMFAALLAAIGVAIGIAQRGSTNTTSTQCADAQTAIDNLRQLGVTHPQFAEIYNAMADSEARAARASGCPNVH